MSGVHRGGFPTRLGYQSKPMFASFAAALSPSSRRKDSLEFLSPLLNDASRVAKRQNLALFAIHENHVSYLDVHGSAKPCHIMLDDSFGASIDPSLVADLRSHFDMRFEDPLKTTSDRFCWDNWYVPYQYSLLRTPAASFFPPALYDRLEDALCEWGERRLGCRGVSPIWLSYYIDGCHQELHTDAPHGPWAFVLSLTKWEDREFKGGETMVLQPQVLEYWRDFDASHGLEMPQLVSFIESRFGR